MVEILLCSAVHFLAIIECYYINETKNNIRILSVRKFQNYNCYTIYIAK
jgi:hypothetical protein